MGLDWNKGLTKENDVCIKKASNTKKKKFQEGSLIIWNKGKTGYMGANKTSFKKGHKPWNTGKKRDKNTKEKIRESVKKAWTEGKLIGGTARKGKKDIKLSQTRKKMFQEGKLISNFIKNNEYWKHSKVSKTQFKPLDKHPQWKGGISFIPYPRDFNNKLKKLIKKRDEFKCTNCGHDGKIWRLEIHHIDKNKFNNNLNNLISLCRKCHGKK